jgi:transposase InsO family protein
MTHANACLTPRGRLKLARAVVEEGWTLARAAERFQCSKTTVKRWSDRYRSALASHGQVELADMVDRSSRPQCCPRLTRRPLVRKIKHLRRKRKLGPAQIAGRLGMASSTVHRVLVREQLNRLDHIDRATGEPIRRYERDRPGELIHVDIKKLGNVPAGGGWRSHGRAAGSRNSRLSTTVRKGGHPVTGYGYVHSAVDDHSRLAYSEILPDEQATTAASFWARAHAWFAAHGISIERVITDNGSCYRSSAWRELLAAQRIKHKRTRPYRPQTNGKVERYNRTLLAEWAYAKHYRSESARRAALPRWLHIYNHHRPHTALGGRPPASRVPNLSGQNI